LEAKPIQDRVLIVLVEPLHPGNVGSAARAMRNFGLERLVLVDPPAYDPERARWMAPGCADLLAKAQIVGSLDEALHGVHSVLGTTARHRKLGHTVIDPVEAASLVCREAEEPEDGEPEDEPPTTAILFGREDFGLSNDAVSRCEKLIRIPTPEHASLNLGQAVLLIAHHLYEEQRRRGLARAPGRTLGGSRRTRTTEQTEPRSSRNRRADVNELEPAVAQLVALLDRVGYTRSTPADKVTVTARQALQQASLSVRHIEALRGMIGRMEWALDHPDEDPRASRAKKSGG
jgi:TrmH family RNA methyltransferase